MHFEKIISTVDTHTAGGPTRIVTAGIPALRGSDVASKMEFFRSNFDSIRKLLMLEPRGHKDMSGAVLTDAVHPEADVGAFFITASGYLRTCVHSTIGIAIAGLHTGFIEFEKSSPNGQLKLEIPAGVVTLTPIYKDESIQSIAVQTAPAFVALPSATIHLDELGSLEVCIVFSGLFFALVDVDQLADLNSVPPGNICLDNARKFAELGIKIFSAVNEECEISHPDKPELSSVDLIMFYQNLENTYSKDIVINASGGIDRTPCGAGMGAKLADLYSRGQIAENDYYDLESFLGTRFSGRVLRSTKVGKFDAIVPQIEGTAHITGMHHFVLASGDPLREGLYVK